MQPRFATQASPAASVTTTSSAVRPEGKLSSTVSIHGGRDDGARFWKNASPSAPGYAAQRPVGDGEVVADDVQLGDRVAREIELSRVRDRHLVPGDLDDLLLIGHASR
jgi:hypothetical protein